MPKIKYQEITMGPDRRAMVDKANEIIEEYARQGFDLTLRQLYYQFVSRDLIANKMSEYKRLGDIINDARLAGLIDWTRIVDRTRELKELSHWASPASIIDACASQFRYDLWSTQTYRVEVWIEKDALAGVIAGVCERLDVPYFSCRGYTSQSEMWAAAMRLKMWASGRQTPIILHLGDHDPSGIDMTRDIQDRLQMFMGGLEVRRLALNFDQVERYSPPPNPAKLSDSRVGAYLKQFGDESWELDALEPAVLADLIQKEVMSLMDSQKMDERLREQDVARNRLDGIAGNFDAVCEWLDQSSDAE